MKIEERIDTYLKESLTLGSVGKAVKNIMSASNDSEKNKIIKDLTDDIDELRALLNSFTKDSGNFNTRIRYNKEANSLVKELINSEDMEQLALKIEDRIDKMMALGI